MAEHEFNMFGRCANCGMTEDDYLVTGNPCEPRPPQKRVIIKEVVHTEDDAHHPVELVGPLDQLAAEEDKANKKMDYDFQRETD